MADATGTTVWRWDQAEPFGNNSANEDPDGDGVAFDLPLRLPGQYYDRESGLHYNYFRDYDPSVGRYVESDPVGLKGGLNTYAYVAQSPLVYSDPRGEAGPVGPLFLLLATKCATGAASGATIESAIQIGSCCYKQCGWALWRCNVMQCSINPCDVAVSVFASCVASAAFPNAPLIPVSWTLLKPVLLKLGMAGVMKKFGKYGRSVYD